MPWSRWAAGRRCAPTPPYPHPHPPHCTPASVGLGERLALRGRGWRFAKRAAPFLRPDGGGERVLQAALETRLSGEGSPSPLRSRPGREVA